jgi:hypothetical protein
MRMKSMNWETTDLGPIETWSQSLKVYHLKLLLTSRLQLVFVSIQSFQWPFGGGDHVVSFTTMHS